jgi:hypothetical protein
MIRYLEINITPPRGFNKMFKTLVSKSGMIGLIWPLMLLRTAAYCFILLLFFSFEGLSQDLLTGKVLRKNSSEVLVSVSVQNHSRKKYTQSDMGGNFRVPAAEGDTVLFTSAGYRPDTLVVRSYMYFDGFEVAMDPNVMSLKAVQVGALSNYEQDSIQRWKDYEYLTSKPKTKLLDNIDRSRHGEDGIGITITPKLHSSEDRDRFRLKKRLDQQEEDYYVDFRFSPEYVAKLTRFQGDTLRRFMTLYRPSYAFCRSAGTVDMLLYVNDSLIKFRMLKPE